MRTALLIGATGLTGNHCLNYLLADELYTHVTVLARRTLSTTHPKLTQYIVDFNNLSESADLIQADDVFCCLGTTIKQAGSKEAFRQVDFEYPLALATIAAANGCKQLLVISAPESNPNSLLFYGRVKAEMEQAISKLSFEGIYIFRPSLLMGAREKYRLAEGLGISLFTTLPFLLSGSLKKFRPIEAKAVANAMVTVAKSSLEGIHSYPSDRIQHINDTGHTT